MKSKSQLLNGLILLLACAINTTSTYSSSPFNSAKGWFAAPNAYVDTDATPLGDKTPLLLVHGIHQSAEGWSMFLRFFYSTPQLSSRFKIYRFSYRSDVLSVEGLGTTLASLMDSASDPDPKGLGVGTKHIIIIAHSMGGLVARSFMSEIQDRARGGRWGDRTLALITLATPHHGSPLANNEAPSGALGSAILLSEGPIQGLGTLEALGTYDIWLNLTGGGRTYGEHDRSDLWWDNYDQNLPVYGSWESLSALTRETNEWLRELNSSSHVSRAYDDRIIPYVGWLEGETIPVVGWAPLRPPLPFPWDSDLGWIGLDAPNRFFSFLGLNFSAQAIRAAIGLRSDGFVPFESASFDGKVASKRVRLFPDYDHAQMWTSKGGGGDTALTGRPELFVSLQGDLLFALHGLDSGSLTVIADPSNGGTTTGTGAYLANSQHEITAKANAGWTFQGWSDGNTQARRTVTVLAGGVTYTAKFVQTSTYNVMASHGLGGTISPTGTFSRSAGSSVTLTAAANPGYEIAYWYLNGLVDQVGGTTYTIPNLQRDTAVQVSFRPVVGTVITGDLLVKITPPEAVTAGAQWRFPGGNYQPPNVPFQHLGPGRYQINFKPVDGYTTPSDYTANVRAGETATVNANYTPITLTTYVLKIYSDHGGVARIPEKMAYSPGEVVRLIASANTDWHFDHWSGDASGTVSFTDVVLDRRKAVTANYAPGDGPGGIIVTLQPEGAVVAGARWKADGGDWQNSGVTMQNVFVGNHYLEFSQPPGWMKPDPRFVAVTYGQTTNVSVTYTQDTNPGILIVTLYPPDAVTAGAKWRVNGAQHDSGANVSFSPGLYTITFDPAPGWTPPASQSITILPGQPAFAKGDYTPLPGQPVIGSIRPGFGRVAGGTLLTIDGANFDAPVTVTIGGKSASNVTVVSPSRLTCLTPPQATYTKTVPVTVQTGTGVATNATGFTYGPDRGVNLNFLTQFGGAINSCAVKGNYVFIGQGSSLVVLDISDSASPHPVGHELAFADRVNKIKIQGDYTYIANGEEGLQVVSITNPTQPALVGTFRTTAEARSVAVLGGRAYVAAKDAGLLIVDVSDPKNLRQLGSVATDGWAQDIVVDDSPQGLFAYVANLFGSFKVVNVTDPASPTVIGSLGTGGNLGNLYSVLCSGNRVYVGAFGGVSIVDVGNPVQPAVIGTFAGDGISVAYSNALLYVVGDATGLHIVDVSTPTNPVEVGAVPGFSAPPLAQITLSGTKAVVAAGVGGLRVIDISNRTAPTQLGQYIDPVGFAGGLALAQNTLYVATGNKVGIFNILDPISPSRLPPLPSALAAPRVRTSGNGAYIVAGDSVQIFDISNPQTPSLRATIQEAMSTAGDIFVSGSMAYLTRSAMNDGWRPALFLYDLSQPSAPKPRGTVHLLPGNQSGSGAGLAIRGNWAFITLGSEGLRIVDVSNPDSLQLRGLLTGLGPAASISVTPDGAHALIACEAAGVKIVDTRDPDRPQMVGGYPIAGELTRSVEEPIPSWFGPTPHPVTPKTSQSMATLSMSPTVSGALSFWPSRTCNRRRS